VHTEVARLHFECCRAVACDVAVQLELCAPDPSLHSDNDDHANDNDNTTAGEAAVAVEATAAAAAAPAEMAGHARLRTKSALCRT
jgi:hypothetical protein